MAGKYQLHVELPEGVLALDDDGGESIADFAESHGFHEALLLMSDWLNQMVAQRRLEKHRERLAYIKAQEVKKRRQKIRVVKSMHCEISIHMKEGK